MGEYKSIKLIYNFLVLTMNIIYNPSIFDIITFTLWNLEKNSDIIKGDRDNNEGVYTRKIGFKLLGDNIKVFY